ncbi:complex I NDUFA9 subunit family protein [Aquisalinus flavus]|uniref:3-beta-hydroxy-Delta(5)-steroid dehydrogenase n=1 Tax=Aquisalinus flavus TaxID=1526572 RepID=A0A8J2V3I1_9PROT|nr:complex I NDUFA9 subunit family protein [Aquisalinus flavus]MBD0425798.1 complex I NDUFA9 subunit family protein [Aquisalinus flavus]UNE48596.1 complex I NDUFA9 subunit family protein [Aquisalinus flavus]GGD13153.1 3-beta-hydroxy-Delta(5)-steroid dehydrogenase [Aquisalinus flavus]
MASKLAVVFGGSGFLGRNVVRELAARGWRVRVAVRRPHHAQFLRPMGAVGQIQLFQGNVRYRPSIAEALKDADAVVNLVGILSKAGKQNFDSVQAQGARNIAELAAREGITNVVHVSAIGADGDSDSDYARTKAEGEAAMREALPSATILRPSIIFGAKDEFFNRFAEMTRFSPALPLIGGGKTKFQPVYVDDVADAVCAALESEAANGRTYELGGPDVKTFRELMEMMLKIIGRKRALVPVPFPIAGMMGAAGDMASILPFVSAPITADQVKLLKRDNIVGISGEDNIGTIQDLGIEPATLLSILPTYLVRYRKYGQFSPETV